MRLDPQKLVRAAAVLMSAVVAAGALACGGAEPRQEAAASAGPPGRALTPAETAAWYQACWGHFNSRAWDRFKACYADTVESEQVDSGQPTARGVEAAMAVGRGFAEAFPDLKGTGELILVNGANLVGIYVLNGTHTGPLLGPDGHSIPATHKAIGIYQAHHLRTDASGARVVKEEFYSDSGTLMAQLGLKATPARPVATSKAAQPTVVVAAGTPAELGNVDRLRAQMAAYNSHDVQGVAAYNAPGLVLHDLGAPADPTPEASLAGMREFFAAFPDARLTPDSVWGAGSYVVSIGRMTATNKGPMPSMGIRKPTGKTLSIRYLDVTRWENGRLVEEWLFYDGPTFARQLGLNRR